MTRKFFYHFYAIPKPNELAHRRNIEPVSSAGEARKVRDYWNTMGLPTAVYSSQSKTSPEVLPEGERLWR